MFPHTREAERPKGEVPKWARRVSCFLLYSVSFRAPLADPHTYADKEQTWRGTRSEDKRGSCIDAAGRERGRERGRKPGGRNRLVKKTGDGGAWGCGGGVEEADASSQEHLQPPETPFSHLLLCLCLPATAEHHSPHTGVGRARTLDARKSTRIRIQSNRDAGMRGGRMRKKKTTHIHTHRHTHVYVTAYTSTQ